MLWSEWCSAESLGLTSDLAGVDTAPEKPMVRPRALHTFQQASGMDLALKCPGINTLRTVDTLCISKTACSAHG